MGAAPNGANLRCKALVHYGLHGSHPIGVVQRSVAEFTTRARTHPYWKGGAETLSGTTISCKSSALGVPLYNSFVFKGLVLS
jgi:hypothetical protein